MEKYRQIDSKQVDVLVLGAGLAGIRAAIAAKETMPNGRVAVVCPHKGPHGSSFANVHNQLGIQVCITPSERRSFVQEAEAIAPPGEIDLGLTEILAKESKEAFDTLALWGAQIKKDPRGELIRVCGCFSPNQPRAFILLDINNFYFKLISRLEISGVEFLPGWQAVDMIQTDGSRVGGALLKQTRGKKQLCVNANATILAIGGTAYSHPVSLAGNGHFALPLHDWCKKNSIPYINDQYIQFVWCKASDFSNWPISNLLRDGSCFRGLDHRIKRIPEKIVSLFPMRKTHAPMAYGAEDQKIDNLLIKHFNSQGWIEIFHPDDGWERITLAAQVSNGGIHIDENGSAGCPGLFACGECAGGMHGANRIGGAMVLAGQVFGKRAGIAAAKASIFKPD